MSEVEICNLALGWLGGNLIISLDDDTVEGRLCKENYDRVRDYCLEIRAWTFATKRAVLSPLAATPAFNFSYQFQLPADHLRTLVATDNPELRRPNSLYWVQEEDKILCDTETLYLQYVFREKDTARYSPTFFSVVAAKLALDIAVPLTHSQAIKRDMAAVFSAELRDSGALDGYQGRTLIHRKNDLRFAR